MTFPCIFDILCDDYARRVQILVPDEIGARIIFALIAVVGLPRSPE